MSDERVNHPRFAKTYAKFAPRLDKAGAGEHRDEMLAGLTGRVLEVGAGTGLNFKRYPATVSEVLAVEPEESLRAVATEAAVSALVPVTVVDGVAGALPVEDASFDAVVASLMLCSVRDLPKALAEMRRAVRPGGELRFYEHVRSGNRALGMMQRGIDLVWPLMAGGCHTSRNTESAIHASGFEIESMRNFTFRPMLFAAPAAPHIIGVARTPCPLTSSFLAA